MNRNKMKHNGAILYLLAVVLITFVYYISELSSGKNVNLIDLFLGVFIPSLSIAILRFGDKSKIVYIQHKVINNLRELDNNKYRINNINGAMLRSVDLDIDNVCDIRIVSENDKSLGIKKIAICLSFVSVAIIYKYDTSMISLLLSLTSISVLITDYILSKEKQGDIIFEFVELTSKSNQVESIINETFLKHMSKLILLNTIRNYKKKDYFIIAYTTNKIKIRVPYYILNLVILITIIKNMINGGIPYIISLFPAILGYYLFVVTNDKSEFNEKIIMKNIQLTSLDENQTIREDFKEIEKISLGNQKYEAVYVQKSKITSIKEYNKYRMSMLKTYE